MECTHTVEYNGETVGRIVLYPMGLFVRLVCKCNLQTKGRYVLFCESQSCRQRLGLLVPTDHAYTYCARIPKNNLRVEPMCFRLYRSDMDSLVTGSPIADLGILASARLQNNGDEWSLESI